METLELVLRFLHFIGLAALVGGAAAALRVPEGRLHRLLVWAAALQLVTGIALFVLNLSDDVNHWKITVKLAVVVIVLVLLHIKKLRSRPLGTWLVLALGVLNTAIAVFW